VAAHPRGPGRKRHEAPGAWRAAASITSPERSIPEALARAFAISLGRADVDRAEDVLEQLRQLRGRSEGCSPRSPRRRPLRVELDARSSTALVDNRRRLGRRADRESGAPGSIRSGEKARKKSLSAESPTPPGWGGSRSRVVPGLCGRLEHDQLVLPQDGPQSEVAASTIVAQIGLARVWSSGGGRR